MRIEDINSEKIKDEASVPTRELYSLRHRCIQVYGKSFEKNDKTKVGDLERTDLMMKYKMLIHEIRSRGLGYSTVTAIDRALQKRAMKGIDVFNFGRIPVIENYLSISGQFLENPKTTDAVEIVIKDTEETRCEELEETIAELFQKEIGKPTAFTYDAEGPEGEHIPVFDLVLQSREKTEKAKIEKKTVDIQKPEITETQIRIPVGSPCDITATITLDAAKGIQALYCGKEKRIRTYLFDKEKWTMATARAWIKENKTKAGEDQTRLLKDEIGKKLTAAQRKECDTETAKIRESEKTAKFPHEFKAAKYTHPNGHPRCLECGDEERIGKVCGMPNKWYEKHEWDDEEAWKEERKKIDFSRAKLKPYFKFAKIDEKQQIVGGVIYSPDEIDTQGDFMSSAKGGIQKAMYKFMENYFKDSDRIKIEHKGRSYAFPILESFVPEEDTKKGDNIIKAGAWWVMIKIKNTAIWKMIESGELEGFSMGGTATEVSPKRR